MKMRWTPQLLLVGVLISANAECASRLPTSAVHMGRMASSALWGSPEMKPDQVNTANWDKGWTNLVNVVEQTFTPSMPLLLAVEVELVVGNANAPEDDLTLSILNGRGEELISVTQTVKTSECEHATFLLPEDGIQVNPGEPYRIRLRGGATFGWKYVIGGYPKGAATFNGKPLLPKARSTFLFRTFGAE